MKQQLIREMVGGDRSDMIVLDEQLLSYGLQASIARWYRRTVTDITQLRPNTVILDEAIPLLL